MMRHGVDPCKPRKAPPFSSILFTTPQHQAASASPFSPKATFPPSSHFRHPLPSFSSPPTVPHRASIPPARASGPDSNETVSDTPPPEASDDFEDRLAQVRHRYRCGACKKAEQRKTRKTGAGKKGSAGGGGVFLLPVPLAEPVSGGLAVDVGLSRYSERLNGRIAMLGLAALLLVDLASSKSVINCHSPAIVLIQLYFVAAVGAVYVKYEKEKVSIWPESK